MKAPAPAHRAGVLASRAARADERFDVICVRTPCDHLVARLEGAQWAVDYRYRNNGRGPRPEGNG